MNSRPKPSLAVLKYSVVVVEMTCHAVHRDVSHFRHVASVTRCLTLQAPVQFGERSIIGVSLSITGDPQDL